MNTQFTYAWNKKLGVYEVKDGAKIVKTCHTMVEVTNFMEPKSKKQYFGIKRPIKKKRKSEVGFGKWGVPSFIMKASSGGYDMEGKENEDKTS